MRINYSKNHSISETELIKAVLPLFFEVSYMSAYLIDLKERKFLYAHADSDFLLGVTGVELLKMSVDEYYQRYYSDDTISFLKNVYKSSEMLFTKLTKELQSEFRVVINLMLQKANNAAQFVQHRIIPIQMGASTVTPRYLFVGVTLSSNRLKRTAIAICGNHSSQSRYKFNKTTLDWDEITPFKLVEREKILLALIYEGYNYMEIARLMSKSPETIKTHKRNLFNKLGVNSSNEAISFAIAYHLF